MKIRFQLCLRLFPAAVAAPSILTVPKLPLMVRCPYHTQHQGKPLACHVMMQSGGKRRRASCGSHTQAKAPFFLPCHKLLCWGSSLAQPCKTLGCGTSRAAGPACEELSALQRRGFPQQAFSGPAWPWHMLTGQGMLSPAKGKAPCSRHLVRGRMTRGRKCEEKGREVAGRGTCWGSATATAALAARGSRLCTPLMPASQRNPCLLAFWRRAGAVSICYWKYSLLRCSKVLTDFYYPVPPPLNDDISAFLAIKKNLHLTCVLQKRPENIPEAFFNTNSQARSNLNLIFATVYTCTHTISQLLAIVIDKGTINYLIICLIIALSLEKSVIHWIISSFLTFLCCNLSSFLLKYTCKLISFVGLPNCHDFFGLDSPKSNIFMQCLQNS